MTLPFLCGAGAAAACQGASWQGCSLYHPPSPHQRPCTKVLGLGGDDLDSDLCLKIIVSKKSWDSIQGLCPPSPISSDWQANSSVPVKTLNMNSYLSLSSAPPHLFTFPSEKINYHCSLLAFNPWICPPWAGSCFFNLITELSRQCKGVGGRVLNSSFVPPTFTPPLPPPLSKHFGFFGKRFIPFLLPANLQ